MIIFENDQYKHEEMNHSFWDSFEIGVNLIYSGLCFKEVV